MNRESRRHAAPSGDGPDDRPDPALFFQSGSRPAFDRKARQLCDQVRRTLEFALDWECDDDVLSGVWIATVDPGGDSSRLRVVLELPAGRDPALVLERLERLRHRLRAEVAAAVTRRRAPDFFFVIGSGGEP